MSTEYNELKVDKDKLVELLKLVNAGTVAKAEHENMKVYSLKNGILRVDIKQDEKK